MIRSLNTAVLGIKQFQTSLDVIGNNLANINTIGYKSARVDFSDTLAQVLRAPTGTTAGVQLGNGVQVSAIKNQFTQGAIKQTGVRTDLTVTGKGFFLVKDSTTSEVYATRAGDFFEDVSGFLVTNDGYRVQGLNKQAPAYTDAQKKEIGDLQLDVGKYMADVTDVSIVIDGIRQVDTITVTAGDHASDTLTVQADGVTKTGIVNVPNVAQADTLTITAGDSASDTLQVVVDGVTVSSITNTANNHDATAQSVVDAINASSFTGSAVRGTGALSNVVIISALTPGTALSGTTTISGTQSGGSTTPSGTLNASGSGSVANVDGNAQTAANIVAAFAASGTFTNGTTVALASTDSKIIKITAGVAGTALGGTASVTGVDGGGSSTDNGSGALNASGSSNVANVARDVLTKTAHGFTTGQQVKFAGSVPTADPAITVNTVLYVSTGANDAANKFTLHKTASDAASGTNAIDFTAASGAFDLMGGASISSFNVGADGKINMLLTDGTQYTRGQVMLQRFRNPQALLKQGSNLFGNLGSAGPLSETGGTMLENSKAPGSSGLGRIVAGALEMSNVDMAQEFSNMITTQRAFQANARMITTSDEILREMMALKR